MGPSGKEAFKNVGKGRALSDKIKGKEKLGENGSDWMNILSVTHINQRNHIFYWQMSQLAAAKGLLLVRGGDASCASLPCELRCSD